MAAILKGGLAVFVKTPELSPVKTRLAADIGVPAARREYEKMLSAAAAMMRRVRREGVAAYWAVGEAAGVSHARWREFPALWTGEGGLGARLHRIYSALQQKHGRAALAGSDCPSLPAEWVLGALKRARGRTVVGPSADGGFYLFAAARRISPRSWNSVVYSRGDTLAQLLRRLPAGGVEKLPVLSDVDDAVSLRAQGDVFYSNTIRKELA